MFWSLLRIIFINQWSLPSLPDSYNAESLPTLRQAASRKFTFKSNLREKLVNSYICSRALHGAETWVLRKVHQKHLQNFEMWCWRRMDISWTDRVRNEEVWRRVKEDRNILYTVKKTEGKLDWSRLAYELPSETRYRRKHIREDRSDENTRKKT